MSSYYKCSLFDKTINDYSKFSFIQEEIVLKNFSKDNKSEFELKKVEYVAQYKEALPLDILKPTAIIPIKDNIELLKFTLKNLLKFEAFNYANFIIVDDRSSENILNICSDYPVNYLRIDNDKGFNFSTLNNIAAKIAYDKGASEIILWNSDLWLHDNTTLPSLLNLHKIENSTITGTKLLYPYFSWNGEEVSHNIKTVFKHKSDVYRGTIQFGGSYFTLNSDLKTYFPSHFCRFKNKDFYSANENRMEKFVTGAFQIINLKWFIENGGLNPSLSKNFQDVDICLTANEQEKKVMYFGKDLFLLHDESVSLSKEKQDNQFISDHVLYSKVWNGNRLAKCIFRI